MKIGILRLKKNFDSIQWSDGSLCLFDIEESKRVVSHFERESGAEGGESTH